MKIELSERMVDYLEKKGIEEREKVEECINSVLHSWLDSKMSREEVNIINGVEEKTE